MTTEARADAYPPHTHTPLTVSGCVKDFDTTVQLIRVSKINFGYPFFDRSSISSNRSKEYRYPTYLERRTYNIQTNFLYLNPIQHWQK